MRTRSTRTGCCVSSTRAASPSAAGRCSNGNRARRCRLRGDAAEEERARVLHRERGEPSYQSTPGASRRSSTLPPARAVADRRPVVAVRRAGDRAAAVGIRRLRFLPQAYVNDFGRDRSHRPRACAPRRRSRRRRSIRPSAATRAEGVGEGGSSTSQLLAQASTTGFSVYLAETKMTAEDWQAYGTRDRVAAHRRRRRSLDERVPPDGRPAPQHLARPLPGVVELARVERALAASTRKLAGGTTTQAP